MTRAEDQEISREDLEKRLERYKETIGFVRGITEDYRDKPALGLDAIRILLKGLKGGRNA